MKSSRKIPSGGVVQHRGFMCWIGVGKSSFAQDDTTSLMSSRPPGRDLCVNELKVLKTDFSRRLTEIVRNDRVLQSLLFIMARSHLITFHLLSE